jgi:hypothetical protein
MRRRKGQSGLEITRFICSGTFPFVASPNFSKQYLLHYAKFKIETGWEAFQADIAKVL